MTSELVCLAALLHDLGKAKRIIAADVEVRCVKRRNSNCVADGGNAAKRKWIRNQRQLYAFVRRIAKAIGALS
ncbi:TPA: hypothetical protein QDB06_001101 [Burkholderia vietnamiensis]|jgi:hypothetical protein|uniref:hypothetical protein n=1 Tax=Burkholderia vietnamiensis TaxID=60552 RepID=UPI0012DB712D|nr:hypothetical protein [Burkholderia vietnamiensis]MBR7974597.1 hypothetical protein [Burkholderia vietnamiensis]MBR8036297.1 hypothetical protein [Burkholderia vietnamiensis]MCA8184418.1 hypothetical protein [Burkholderia vietnamiensis]HDR9180575.1 hypothetical protein [Burkholderia vietnamiensis]HDV8352254.1 hypothetical protein [Burkholderia vietnamiensis]